MMNNDPIARFKELLGRAEQLGIHPYNAAAFATTGCDLQPSARVLLLKGVDQKGFVFYTNLRSRKARQIQENARAAACFWWAHLHQQVRIEGSVELVSDAEADEYFATRARGSQIAAWASNQSSDLCSREEILTAVTTLTVKYKDRLIPRPPHWSGYRLVPERIEFWKEQPDRLHERELYTRRGEGWNVSLLAP
jgi:pyridoxamine 5'-phosphate oxidase